MNCAVLLRPCWKHSVVALPIVDLIGGSVAVRAQVEPSPTAPPLRALLHVRHVHKGSHPMGNCAPAPTAIQTGAHPQRRLHMSSSPTGNRAPAPTATPPGARPQQQPGTSNRAIGCRYPAPTVSRPGARQKRRMHTTSIHCTIAPATPRQQRQVPVPRGSFPYEEPLPRTAVRPRPLQYIQVPAPCGE